MDNTKLVEYHTYRNMIKFILLSLGLWPLDKPSRFYNILPFIQLLLSGGTAFAIFGYVKFHFKNIAAVTKGLSIMTSFFTVILKVICIISNRKDAYELHKLLDSYFDKMLNDPNLNSTVLNGVTTFRCLSWAVAAFVFVSFLVYVFAPIFFIIYQHIHHIEPIKYLLPYPGIYPWPISPNGFLYKCHYIFEILASLSMLSLTSSVEPLFSLYVFQMIGQIREMTRRLAKIETTNGSEFRQCTIQYSTLMRCRDVLQQIYGPIILWMMGTNAIILCTLMFQLTQVESISIGRAVLFGAYIGLKLTQTFIYSWSGTQLTMASADYLTAVYSANWYGNKRHMSYVLIMLAQKPLTLTACKFSVVSLDMLVMVLNTTISYLFLLRTLDDKV